MWVVCHEFIYLSQWRHLSKVIPDEILFNKTTIPLNRAINNGPWLSPASSENTYRNSASRVIYCLFSAKHRPARSAVTCLN